MTTQCLYWHATMRITRDTLLKIARDTAAQRVRISRRLVCIYLTGSLLQRGTAAGRHRRYRPGLRPRQRTAACAREVVRLSDEVHLDIAHYSQDRFSASRATCAWIPGWDRISVSHPLVLHDSGHWFDFTQASIRAQFDQPDNT